MTLISRYVLRAHIAPFLFGTITVMFLFLLQFLMNFIDKIVGKGLSIWVITQLIALNLAWMVVLAVPMGVLVSTLMGFGNLSSTNEITIVKAAGGSLFRLMRPVVLSAAIVTGLLFWFNDSVLPDANHKTKVLMNDIQRKKPTFAVEKGQFSTQIEGYGILARNIDSAGTLLGVTIYDNTQVNHLNVVSADSGIIAFTPDYSKLIVTLLNGEIHQINQQNYGDYRKVIFQHHQIAMNAGGFEFTRSDESVFARGDREMRIADMRLIVEENRKFMQEREQSLADKIREQVDLLFIGEKSDSVAKNFVPPLLDAVTRADGRMAIFRAAIDADMSERQSRELTADKYLVEIYKKYAIPFACLAFIFVGCPLGIITKRGNFGISAAISLGFYVLYWACLISGEKLADRGILAPWLGMWLGNIIIGGLGIFLTIRVANESISFDFSKILKIFTLLRKIKK